VCLPATLVLTSCGESGPLPGGTVKASATKPAALPTDFPTSVPQPTDFALVSSVRSTIDGDPAFTVAYRAPGAKSDALQSYIDDLRSQGYTVTSKYDGEGIDRGGVWQMKSSKWRVGVTGTVATDATTVVVSIVPAPD